MLSFLEVQRMQFMEFAASQLGYEGAMVLKNLIIFASGSAFAFIFATLLGARIMMSITCDKRAKGAALIRVNDNSPKGYTLYAHPRNMRQFIQTYCTYIVWTIRGRRDHVTFTDEKIGCRLLFVFTTLSVILFTIGVWFAVQIFPSIPI